MAAETVVIATWPFGKTAADAAVPLLVAGKPALDAALAGARAVEDDPKVNSVGFGGLGDAVGTVTLDACVMDGRTLGCGAVAGVENVRHVGDLARRVMEKSPHILLVGDGARTFALREGFPSEVLSTPESLAEWEKRRPKQIAAPLRHGEEPAHDTVTVLTRDAAGHFAGVCTTSGLPHKLPGRVGDSPLIGPGLYVDNEAGAAGSTGVGEEIIRSGGALLIVEAMRAGQSAQEACEAAVQRVIALAARRGVQPASLAFVAIDTQGRTGAACTPGTGFRYAVGRGAKIEMMAASEGE